MDEQPSLGTFNNIHPARWLYFRPACVWQAGLYLGAPVDTNYWHGIFGYFDFNGRPYTKCNYGRSFAGICNGMCIMCRRPVLGIDDQDSLPEKRHGRWNYEYGMQYWRVNFTCFNTFTGNNHRLGKCVARCRHTGNYCSAIMVLDKTSYAEYLKIVLNLNVF